MAASSLPRDELDRLNELLMHLAGAGLDDVDPPAGAEDVELLACTLAMPLDTHDTPAEFGGLLARAVAGRGDELAAGLLAAFARMGGASLADAAEIELHRLATAGVASPFVDEIGSLRAEEAYCLELGDGDAELIGLLLRRPHAHTAQPAVLFIEYEDCGGVVAGITVAEPAAPEAARRLLRRPGGGGAAAVRRPVEEVAKRLRSVLDHMIDHDVPLSSEHAPLLPFVGSALAGRGGALPRPPVELEPTDTARDDAGALVDAFAAELDEQGADQALVDHAPFLAHLLLSWRLDFGDGELLRWTAADVREFLLEWYPRKGDADDETLAAVRPSLAAFLRFLAERSLLEGDSIEGLEAALVRLETRFAHAARDRRNWGPAKALTTQMRAEGVDPTDPDALEAWMADFNSRPRAERDAVLGGGAAELAIRLPSSGAPARHAPSKVRRSRRRASRAARRRNRR